MISHSSMISRRLPLLYLILMSISSLAMHCCSAKVFTLMTSSFLFSCFSICSMVRSSPLLTMVMQDTSLLSVSPTTRLSMLKQRLANRPATLPSTPERFSTSTEYILFFIKYPPIPVYTRSIGSITHSSSMDSSFSRNASMVSSHFSMFSSRRNGMP